MAQVPINSKSQWAYSTDWWGNFKKFYLKLYKPKLILRCQLLYNYAKTPKFKLLASAVEPHYSKCCPRTITTDTAWERVEKHICGLHPDLPNQNQHTDKILKCLVDTWLRSIILEESPFDLLFKFSLKQYTAHDSWYLISIVHCACGVPAKSKSPTVWFKIKQNMIANFLRSSVKNTGCDF